MKQWIIQRFRRLACRSFCLRCRNVAEHQLGQLVSFAIPPDLHDVVHALIDLCARFIRQHLVDDSLVQAQLTAIRGNLEHIVLGRVNGSAVYQRCALRKGLDHFLLMFGRLRHDVVVFHLRGGQVQLVGGLDVRHFFEQVHQLRQVEKLGESSARPIAGAFGNEFVKMIFVSFLNSNIYPLKNLPTSRVCIFLETPYSKASSHFPIASH